MSTPTRQLDGMLGFIGAGNMAGALARGAVSAGAIPAARVCASDLVQPLLDKLSEDLPGVQCFNGGNAEVASRANLIIVAVKPDVVPIVLNELAPHLTPNHCIVSIAAGVPIEAMAACLPEATRIVRVMPNTPCMVGESAAAYACGPAATDEDKANVETVFGAVGEVMEVKEKLLDAVTGVSGSGPAFVFNFIEALADGAVRAGLPRHVALRLAAQTVRGAATMVLETGKHPGELKDMVTSPGGTTIAGVHALEERGFRGTVMNAVVAAADRATEMGKKK
mmetsp:Transcript_20047/g.60739  ORF Transcript_20047/g.60739 Transcript_20047/m.60739 type:complete len:280 (+) Transcript_20047:371-1210(+)